MRPLTLHNTHSVPGNAFHRHEFRLEERRSEERKADQEVGIWMKKKKDRVKEREKNTSQITLLHCYDSVKTSEESNVS